MQSECFSTSPISGATRYPLLKLTRWARCSRSMPPVREASLQPPKRMFASTLSRQAKSNAGTRQPAGKADRRAVRAPACRARQCAIVVELNRIHAAGDRRHRNYLVAHRCESRAHAVWYGPLDLERIAFGPDPGAPHRLLQAHTVIDQIDQCLQRAWKHLLSR